MLHYSHVTATTSHLIHVSHVQPCSYASSTAIPIGLLLSVDIQPIISIFIGCTLNIRSLLDPLRYLFELNETWITSSAELRNATPPGVFLHDKQPSCSSCMPAATSSHIVSGAFLISKPALIVSTLPSQTFKSIEIFQYLRSSLKLFDSKLTMFNVYHPPSCQHYNTNTCPFLFFSIN